MKKRICFLLAILLGATLLLVGCNDRPEYSGSFQEGAFAIQRWSESDIFTEESEIELLRDEKSWNYEGFKTTIGNLEYLFIFRNLAPDVAGVFYSYSTDDNLFVFFATRPDGSKQLFSLYSYDWTDKIGVKDSDIYFERYEKPETLYPEIEIKNAYLKTHLHSDFKDLTVKLYGIFDESYVVLIQAGVDDGALTTDIIDGVVFYLPKVESIEVYYRGELCTLREAYSSGLLSFLNLLSIQQTHKAAHKPLYMEYNEIERKIVSAYAEHRGIEESKVVGPYFCSMFHDADTYVIMICADGDVSDDEITEITVDDVLFTFDNSWVFDVYHNGEFYSLQEAFDNGYLSHDDLLTVQRNWSGMFY